MWEKKRGKHQDTTMKIHYRMPGQKKKIRFKHIAHCLKQGVKKKKKKVVEYINLNLKSPELGNKV